MTQAVFSPETRPKRRLPTVTTASPPTATRSLDELEAEIARYEAAERRRLGLEGDDHPRPQWREEMHGLGFTRREKSKITLLIGGLTMAHDHLIRGAINGLGYHVIALDAPDQDALRVGKEFGNRAQCNPTYFTVGNLVKYLIDLRDREGLSAEEIVDKYVFLTAGACGPCRFGMYVTEYRKALRDAGFDGFRVMLFQQQGGLDQATGDESGLELKPAFFIGLVKGIIAGDVLNALAYRIRPYEVVPGATDRAVLHARELCHDALRDRKSILWALWRAGRELRRVEVDRLRCKPKVAIIGEFWAMTTEGDGNYRLQRFLEQEGAECDIQLVTAWILYNAWEVRFDTASRAHLRGTDGTKRGLRDAGEYGVFKRRVGLWAADHVLRGLFQLFAHAGGLYGYHLPDMDELAQLAGEHYDNDLRGGEGHMEVGKLILNVLHQKATMTLSVKPFGCMPSSGVSDGVQSLITEKYPGSIFCAVETSGDGPVNFESRVQMMMFKAHEAARRELAETLSRYGLTLDAVRAELARRPRLRSALHYPKHQGAHTAANVVHEIARLKRRSLGGFVGRLLNAGLQRLRSAPDTAGAVA